MRGFTLIEVLIAIGVVMVLSVAVLLVLNPFELRRQAQDAARVSDLRTLEESMNFALSSAALTGQVFDSDGPNFPDDSCDGQANQRVFVSVPSDNGEVTSTLPSGWVWQQVARADLRKTDGNGWLPVNFQGYAGAGLSALQALPVDPTNTFASGLYYSYVCGSYEINAALASQKYRTKLLAHDGGDDNELLEIGSKLVIAPVRPSQGAPPSTAPSVSSITPSSGENTGLVNITNISGQNFQGSSTVKLAKSGQLDITGVGFSVPNSTTMSGGAFNLNGAATGPWDVVVTNPDAQFGTLVGGFTVTNPPSFDFSLSNAGNRSVVQGSSVTSTITATLVSSPTQSVSFTASGLPAGASASFGPADLQHDYDHYRFVVNADRQFHDHGHWHRRKRGTHDVVHIDRDCGI
ncbi:MAG: PKD domain containing protein [Parcubacteria group bacterium GW2011_GWB1_56_8]|nr:MAG: PKD domain containing protein [Parcubacteria group bacterium GW2011_GWB1_56_8]